MLEPLRRAPWPSTLASLILVISDLARTARLKLRRLQFVALAIPALSSLPGAPVAVYLDFDGHSEETWGAFSNVNSPAYDRDGDPKSFSASEVVAICEIWGRVAEDYAPFNINVTTVDPRDYSNRRRIHVVIGGHYADWYKIRVGGVSFANSFTNDMPNVVYVFSRALGGGLPKYVADLISHEVGHTFGLEEQSVYGQQGDRLRDYNIGEPKHWGPLMGNSLGAPRSIWHYGTSTSARTMQDDIAIIARSENGFGLRRDDHGDAVDKATLAGRSPHEFHQHGVVNTLRDRDCFLVHCEGGHIDLTVTVAQAGPNLDARLELCTAAGEVIAYDDPEDDLNCHLEAALPKGHYYAIVTSHGAYGDLGQYTLDGTMAPDASVAQIKLVKHTKPVVRDPDVVIATSTPPIDESGAAKPSASPPVQRPAAGPATR